MWAAILVIMPFSQLVDVSVDRDGKVPFPHTLARAGLGASPFSALSSFVVAIMMVGWSIAASVFLPLAIVFFGATIVLLAVFPGASSAMSEAFVNGISVSPKSRKYRALITMF